jgi:uncharacterized membrane protein YcfT
LVRVPFLGRYREFAIRVQTANTAVQRVDWVDYAKGICIVLVVMMHSILGVEAALGEVSWLNGFIAWARPFRMPDFFLISGLFLAARIDRSRRDYLDTKLIHFACFYILWMTIQFGFKGPGMVAENGAGAAALFYLESFIAPFGTLWFIYFLGVFFVVTKALHRVPVIAIWLGAALLEVAIIETGWMVIDEFAPRFAYFYTGYILAPYVFAIAKSFSARGTAAAVIALSVLFTRASFMDWCAIAASIRSSSTCRFSSSWRRPGLLCCASALSPMPALYR